MAKERSPGDHSRVISTVLHFLYLHGGKLVSDRRLLATYADLDLDSRRVLLSYDAGSGRCCFRVLGGERELWGECTSVEAALVQAIGG
jgi:hypothetical protein